jgi:hypothetical protein
MAWGTTYSRNACKWIVDGGGIAALCKWIRSCNRSESHQAMLLSILTILDNILRHSEQVMPIEPALLAKGVSILCENLQYFRCGHTSTQGGCLHSCNQALIKVHLPCACARRHVLLKTL